MTDKQRILMNLSPNYRAFVDSNDHKRCSILLSMAYLTHTIADAYNSEAISLMEKYDLIHKKIKTRATGLATAYDLYDKEIQNLITDQEATKQLCGDYDHLKGILDKYMNIDKYVNQQ